MEETLVVEELSSFKLKYWVDVVDASVALLAVVQLVSLLLSVFIVSVLMEGLVPVGGGGGGCDDCEAAC